MAGKNTAVFGLYRSRSGVENGVDALKQERLPQHRYLRFVPGECGHQRLCP